MKQYLSRDNILIVLGAIFTAITFFYTQMESCQSELLENYDKQLSLLKSESKQMAVTNQVLELSYGMGREARAKRAKLVNWVLKNIENPKEKDSVQNLIFQLKDDILQHEAKLSKFEFSNLHGTAKELFLTEKKALNKERNFIFQLDKFHSSISSKKQSNSDIEILQNSYLETTASLTQLSDYLTYQKKLFKNEDAESKEKQKDFDELAKEYGKSRNLYSILFSFSISLFLIIVIVSLKYGVFKKEQ